MQSCDVDLDKEITKMGQPEPFILVSEQVGTSNVQYFICIEQAPALKVKTLRDAFVDTFLD